MNIRRIGDEGLPDEAWNANAFKAYEIHNILQISSPKITPDTSPSTVGLEAVNLI